MINYLKMFIIIFVGIFILTLAYKLITKVQNIKDLVKREKLLYFGFSIFFTIGFIGILSLEILQGHQFASNVGDRREITTLGLFVATLVAYFNYYKISQKEKNCTRKTYATLINTTESVKYNLTFYEFKYLDKYKFKSNSKKIKLKNNFKINDSIEIKYSPKNPNMFICQENN
jgi:hypothetical protein